ncbi:sulfatase [Thalassoglobus sp.]|uniref:sulfatase family protein n=1 Tax=Thalassoglobus sp. TaxID=2795869 RepID=UPI003AA88EB8
MTLRLLMLLQILAFSPLHANERPNILFCIADDASYSHFGAYGNTWVKTPGFDRVAREGILFNNCYTPNAKCAPSRACILTGRNTWQLEEACNHMPFFPAKFKSYVEALNEHGYHTGKTMKGWAPGVAVNEDGSRRHLAGTPYNKRKAKPPTNAISNNDYAGNFEDFLAANRDGKPFCFWYGCVEPHRRYEYGSGVAKAGKKLTDIDSVPGFWPDNETVRNDMLDYAYEVEHFDTHLVRMLKILEDRGELENTIVVVTSDNGMPFPRIKGQEYELSNHLPLAIMWPKGIKSAGRKIDDYVSFIDYAPTFLEVAGVSQEDSKMAAITGRSLVEYFNTEKEGIVFKERDHVLIGKERHDVGRPHDWGYPIRGIVKDGHLYLHNFETSRWPVGNPETGYLNTDGSPTKTDILNKRRSGEESYFWDLCFGKRPQEELFNIKEDPECLNNLATASSHEELKAQLKKQLFAELKDQGDPRLNGNPEVFDNCKVSSEPNANFYERFMRGEKLNAGWVNESDFEKEAIQD